MDERKHIIEGIKKFIRRINKDFQINKIIFFGSRTTNKYNKDSDIDLIIVSDDFEGLDFFERVSKMYNYWELDYPVDFLCYTLNEFTNLKKRISIIKYAIKKGIII
jgi:predicted nucleotidyltransferase